MLVSLHVKNVALIDEVEVYFNRGLNILSGETGAGKSILIGSINLALGERADADVIRTGAEYALVELIFQVDSKSQLEKIRGMDIPVEDDGMILLQRKIMPGRSICKVCGEMTTAKTVKDVAEILINIHGQSQTQTLADKKRQLEFIDTYAGETIKSILETVEEDYIQFKKMDQEMKEFDKDDTISAKELSLAQFEYEEIEQAFLKVGEDKELEEKYQIMLHSKRIAEGLSEVSQILNAEEGVLENTARAIRSLKEITKFDTKVLSFYEQMDTVDGILSDFSREIVSYMEDSTFSSEDFITVENRLNLINHQKEKYGKTIEDVLKHQKDILEKIERLTNREEYKNKAIEQFARAKKQYESNATILSNLRKSAANELQKEIEEVLLDLNFEAAVFEIHFEKKDSFASNGIDESNFYISTNIGEPCKLLSAIASGGELSRIMLAFKTVMAKKDAVEALIFDEIDSGISGKTAWKVAEKLGQVSKDHQVLCITHLAQIAAMADTHFLIEKITLEGVARTHIHVLTKDRSINELARLLGGETITEAARINAIELHKLAHGS